MVVWDSFSRVRESVVADGPAVEVELTQPLEPSPYETVYVLWQGRYGHVLESRTGVESGSIRMSPRAEAAIGNRWGEVHVYVLHPGEQANLHDATFSRQALPSRTPPAENGYRGRAQVAPVATREPEVAAYVSRDSRPLPLEFGLEIIGGDVPLLLYNWSCDTLKLTKFDDAGTGRIGLGYATDGRHTINGSTTSGHGASIIIEVTDESKIEVTSWFTFEFDEDEVTEERATFGRVEQPSLDDVRAIAERAEYLLGVGRQLSYDLGDSLDGMKLAAWCDAIENEIRDDEPSAYVLEVYGVRISGMLARHTPNLQWFADEVTDRLEGHGEEGNPEAIPEVLNVVGSQADPPLSTQSIGERLWQDDALSVLRTIAISDEGRLTFIAGGAGAGFTAGGPLGGAIGAAAVVFVLFVLTRLYYRMGGE